MDSHPIQSGQRRVIEALRLASGLFVGERAISYGPCLYHGDPGSRAFLVQNPIVPCCWLGRNDVVRRSVSIVLRGAKRRDTPAIVGLRIKHDGACVCKDDQRPSLRSKSRDELKSNGSSICRKPLILASETTDPSQDLDHGEHLSKIPVASLRSVCTAPGVQHVHSHVDFPRKT